MDYLLALSLSADARGLRVGLNAGAQEIRQFGRKAEQSFQGVAASGRKAAHQVRDDWTKAARDNTSAQAAFAKDATAANRKAMQDASRNLREVKAGREATMQEISRGLLLTSAAFGLGILGTVNVTRKFNAEISTLGAVADASGQELMQLRQAVLDAGQATVYSASEAAKGAQELARAGVSVQNIIGGGLKGALNLAAAGQLDLGEASEIAATAMNVFNLKGTQMAHISDVLAAGAGKAQGNLHDMGYALKQSALVANQFGLSLDETVGGLSLFASRGLIGSDAGTSFRTMLLRLNPQSKEAGAMMKQLGLDFYDAQGDFVGIKDVAGQLSATLGHLSDEQRDAALNVIFGQDAIRGANILVQLGAEGYQKYIDAVNDFGYANRQASKNMDNLNGDLERLKGSFEVALIGTGEQADGVLRDLVQTTDLMVSAYSDLPDELQGGIIAMSAFIAVGTGAVGLVGTMIPKYRALNDVFSNMGKTGATLSTALRMTTIGLGVASAAAAAGLLIYGIYAQKKAEAKAQTDRLTEALYAERDGQIGASTAAILSESSYKRVADKIRDLGINQSTYLSALKGSKVAQDQAIQSVLAANPGLEKNAATMKAVNEMLFNTDGNLRSREAAQLFAVDPKLAKSLEDVGKQYSKLSPSVRKSIEDSKNDASTKKDLRSEVLEFNKAQGLTGGTLERATQAMSGQKDELSDLAAELDVTRETLVEWGKGSEEAGQQIAKSLKQAEEATSKSFASFGDVIGKFGGQQSVAGGDIRKFYKDTIKQSSDFARQIEQAIQRGLDPALVSRLLQAGPEQAAPILKTLLSDHSGNLIKMTNESEDKLREINTLAVQLARITNLAVNDRGDQMAKDSAKAMAIVQAAYENGGTISAQKLNEKLGIGLEEAKRITGAYGLSIVTGFNQVRSAFDAAPISAPAITAISKKYAEDPSKVDYKQYAEGGIENHTAHIAPGQSDVRVFAEPETGGEAYIPLSPTKRQRSTDILHTVAGQFGLDVIDPRHGGSVRTFASGGIYGVYPPVRPGAGSVGQAMYAGANSEYKLLEKFYEESKKQVGGGWQSITSFLTQQGAPFTVTSTTGGQHAPGSYHYAGKAVDLVSPDMLSLFHTLERASSSLSELFYDPAGYSYKKGARIAPIGGHSDHVHAATYDQGGWIKPGMNAVYNGSSRPEAVFTADQFDRLIEAVHTGNGAPIYVSGDSKSVVAIARETASRVRPKR